MSQNGGDFFKGLVFGGLIGALLGVLYAPKSGRETREDLTHKADEFIAKAKEELEKNREDYEAALGRIKKVSSSVKGRALKAEEKISKLALSGKKEAQERKKKLQKALEAGVAAYRGEKRKKKRA